MWLCHCIYYIYADIDLTPTTSSRETFEDDAIQSPGEKIYKARNGGQEYPSAFERLENKLEE